MRISDWSSDVCSSDLMVIARLAEPYRSLAAKRHYLPSNVPLVKRVAAVPGDRICARGDLIFVNGKPVTERLKIDARGRAMPWWRGCVRLGITQFLLLMTDRSEEHTSELQSLMRISSAVFCLKKKKTHTTIRIYNYTKT